MSLQSSSLSRLPWDLVEEILARVPAISLKRLRSTCKQWNVLFNDQRFTKKHFDKAQKQFMVLMLWDFRCFSMSVNLHGLRDNIDPSIEVKGELILIDPRFSFLKNAIVFEVFHCNGLLLCKTVERRLIVWNPCTGQTKWIETNHDGDHTPDHMYALGYENNKSCYNHKILKFCDDLDTFDLEIYEFKSNSWRVLGNITPNFKISLNVGVSLKGNTYWIGSHKEVEELVYDFLISFDFTRERFGPRVRLPFKGFCFHDSTISLSCVREERLSIFFQDYDKSKMEIWMSNNITETKAMSWSQFFKINFITHWFGIDVSFIIDEENKVIVLCDHEEDDDTNDIVYIIGEDQYWREVDIGPRSDRMLSYVPSFVQI